MGGDLAAAVIRFFLRSPLLWIGVFMTTYISWLGIGSGGEHMGFNYSRNGHLVVVCAGAERLVLGWASKPGLNRGLEPLVPGGIPMLPRATKHAPVSFASRSGPEFRHWRFSIALRDLLAAHLVLWYGFLGWRAWRYHRRHAVPLPGHGP